MNEKTGWIDNGVEDCAQTTGDWVGVEVVENGFGEG